LLTDYAGLCFELVSGMGMLCMRCIIEDEEKLALNDLNSDRDAKKKLARVRLGLLRVTR
jgi:hypothetical protein